MKERKIADHAPDCFAAHRPDSMALIGRRRGFGDWETTRRLDKAGRKRGRTTLWHVAICLDPKCPAEMVVQLDDEVASAASRVGL